MSFIKLALGSAASIALAASANATVVTSIKITSAVPTWLQVSEVIATQFGTGADVALATAGATATASSNYGGSDSPSYAIDGVGPSAYPSIYHSGSPNAGEYLLVTLAHAFDLSGLTIDGRTDCCSERDHYAYQLFDGASLVGSGQIDGSGATHSGSASFPAAVPEPASWAMMVGGFGLLGGALRRKKAHVTFA